MPLRTSSGSLGLIHIRHRPQRSSLADCPLLAPFGTCGVISVAAGSLCAKHTITTSPRLFPVRWWL
jgi:hypothetical protein